MMGLDGIKGLLSSSRFQGINDLAGRAGNVMQGLGGAPQQTDPTQPSTMYSPQEPGLAGIRTSLGMSNGDPIKFGSRAPVIAGGGRMGRPGSPDIAAPPMSNSGAPIY